MKIGLEVHVALPTRSKLFCSCSTEGAEPNSSICPICMGFPGSSCKCIQIPPVESYSMDLFTIPPNLGGFPHVSFPYDYVDGMPLGAQLVTGHGNDLSMPLPSRLYNKERSPSPLSMNRHELSHICFPTCSAASQSH